VGRGEPAWGELGWLGRIPGEDSIGIDFKILNEFGI
jgi:hypothetical protein